MKTFALLFFLFEMGASAAYSKPLPPDTALVPLTADMHFEWSLDKTPSGGCLMTADPKGSLWLLCRQRFLIGPAYGAIFPLDRAVDGVAWSQSGLLFATSGGEAGVFPVAEALKARQRPPMPLAFKRLGKFPMTTIHLAGGAGNVFYAFGRNDKTSKNDIYVLQKRRGRWGVKLLAATLSPVSAVAGGPERVFIASGKRVISIPSRTAKSQRLRVIFSDLKSEITGLAYSPKTGLLYATERGAGFIGDDLHFRFLTSRNVSIQLDGTSLLVMLSDQRGVLKIEGMDSLLGWNKRLAEALKRCSLKG